MGEEKEKVEDGEVGMADEDEVACGNDSAGFAAGMELGGACNPSDAKVGGVCDPSDEFEPHPSRYIRAPSEPYLSSLTHSLPLNVALALALVLTLVLTLTRILTLTLAQARADPLRSSAAAAPWPQPCANPTT